MVQMIKLHEEDYDRIVRYSIAAYADDLRQTDHLDGDEALEKSRQEFAGMLPQGYQTPGHEFYTLLTSSGEEAGFVWVTVETAQGRVFVSDIEIYPAYQHQGFGTYAMQRIEDLTCERGLQQIELSVFKHNPQGMAFYDKLGYHVIEDGGSYFDMRKVFSE